jgi:putative NIF3 family GTP cyclohydrolase 1 type 2
MKRDALVHWLDNYLDIGSFQDPSLNGLQVEGAVEVVKVAVAVDSSLSTFEQAAELGADMLIVHHGLFWGEALAVTGTHKRREDFGAWKGRAIGVKGRFPNPVNLRELADQIEQELGEAVLVHAGGEMELRSLGIISGSAAREVITAASEGLDALLTGEPKHDVFHEAFERRINALYAGHYMTETVGVKLLAERLENEFDLTTEFILLPTGL